MTTKYHIGENGPGECHVDPSNPNSRGCPFGGESGQENHFDSMREAQHAYEDKMEKEHGEVAKTTRKKKEDTSNVPEVLKKSLTEQNKLAKETESASELEDLADSKSDRVKLSVLKNPKVNFRTLKKIYDNNPSFQLKSEILNNTKMPLREMTDEDFDKTFKKRGPNALSYGGPLSEERANKVLDHYEEKGKNSSYYREQDLTPRADVLYFSNKEKNGGYSEKTVSRLKSLSPDIERKELLNGSVEAKDFSKISGETYSKIALSSDLGDKFYKFPEKKIDALYESGIKNIENDKGSNLEYGMNTRDTEQIKKAFTVKVLANKNVSDRTMNKIIDNIGDNDNSQYSEAIKKQILFHPKANQETKNRVTNGDKKLARELKYEKLGGKDQIYKDIKATSSDLKENNRTEKNRFGTGQRSYYSTSFKVNKDRIKEMGLDDEDLKDILGSQYNATAHYDPETGIFKGSIDSSG